MWSTETYFGSAYEFYRVKDTGEKVGKATCTTCGTNLAVFKGVLEGVLPEEREDLVSIRERGI